MSVRRILVIHRRSQLEQSTGQGDRSPLAHLIARRDPVVADVLRAHEEHGRSMQVIREELERRGLVAVWRHDLRGVFPDDFDLVITVGGDGTVLHASHAIGRAPVLAVNSAPSTSTGYFAAATAATFGAVLDRLLAGQLASVRLYRMDVLVNGEVVSSRVLNDVLFSNPCPASTTRYVLRWGDREETQMSSGVWIATAAGSTAAVRAAGGDVMHPGDRGLQFVVREPCPVPGSAPRLVRGRIGPDGGFSLQSKSTEAHLYVDGPHVVIPVRFGDIITFAPGLHPLSLYGDLAGRSGLPGVQESVGLQQG